MNGIFDEKWDNYCSRQSNDPKRCPYPNTGNLWICYFIWQKELCKFGSVKDFWVRRWSWITQIGSVWSQRSLKVEGGRRGVWNNVMWEGVSLLWLAMKMGKWLQARNLGSLQKLISIAINCIIFDFLIFFFCFVC